ncbi:MAG: amidohydrolase family protein, partial [Gemmatimonadota bacterium]|nr:amidohydrolase family protein [Gemmatimonadota bacterium]
MGERVVLPGLVDTHVHVNEPGRTEWEGFRTASRAAASGGVTTLVDMPLNSDPVTTSPEALARKADAAGAACRVDHGFWGGLVPDSVGAIEALYEAGALGFKAFLVDSGLPDFPPVEAGDLRRAMPTLAAMGVPLLV